MKPLPAGLCARQAAWFCEVIKLHAMSAIRHLLDAPDRETQQPLQFFRVGFRSQFREIGEYAPKYFRVEMLFQWRQSLVQASVLQE